MAVRLGSAYGQINIDASGAVEGTNDAQMSVSGFGDTLKSVFSFAAGNLVAEGFRMLTGGMKGLFDSALDSASQLQDLGLAMETLVAREIAVGQGIELTEAMEGAGEAAESLLGDLQELAIVSPFEYTTVSNVLRVQMAFGATSETAMDLTRAILNTGAALGQSGAELDRMNYNLAQALVMGDLTGGNLRQLKMAGLDLAGVLEGELSMSIDEVRDALEDGSMTMEEVSEAFVNYTDKNFGNAAERMSKTFSGLKSSIADLWFFAGSDLLTPALEVVTEVLGDLFDQVNEVVRGGMLKRVGEQLGEGLRTAVMWLKEQAIPWLRKFGETFTADVLPKIRELVSKGIAWLVEKGQMLWAWIQETAIPRLREWGETFKTEVLPQIREFARNGIEWLLEKGQMLWAWIQETAIPRLREWGTVFLTETLPMIRDFVRDGIEWLMEKGQALWAWITETAIPRLREWGTVFLTETLPMIRDFVRDGIEWLMEKGQALWAWITETAIPRLREWGTVFLTETLPMIQGFVRDGIGWLMERGQALWAWITETAIPRLREWGTVFMTETLPMIQGFVRDGIEWLKTKGQEVWTWITETAIPKLQEWGETFKTDVLPMIEEFVRDGIEWLQTKGQEVWAWITETAIPKLQEWGETFKTDVMPKVQEFVDNTLVPMWEKAQEIWAWIVDTAIPKLQEWGEAFVEGFRPFAENVMPRLREFYEDVKPRLEAALDSLRRLWDKLKDAFDRIAVMYEERLEPALDKLAEMLGINKEEGGSFMELFGNIAGATFWAFIEGAILMITGAIEAFILVVDLVTISIDLFVTGMEGIVDAANNVLDIIGDLMTKFEDLSGIDLPDWLTPGSPTPFEIGLRGIADAVRGLPDLAAGMGLGGMPALAPAMVGAGGGGGGGGGAGLGGLGGGESTVVNFYGPVSLPDVTDGASFLEELTRMADGR